MAHLFLSAVHKSSGKTTLAIGLCAEWYRLGQQVQPFKKGPDYIDPLWLSLAAGRHCWNLDFYTLTTDEILQRFGFGMVGADIGLIEGNKGLHDGMALDGSNSNAALAVLLGAPVVLVLDCQGMTRGVAPLVLGTRAFNPAVRVAGVILNKVAGVRHEGKLREALAYYTDVPVVGAVHRRSVLSIEERHLGLVPGNEQLNASHRIDSIRLAVVEAVDMSALTAIAASAPPVSRWPVNVTPGVADQAAPPRIRIGIAQDSAFGFYYPDDLLAMERHGVEIVPFSPLTDTRLPAVDGLFLGGGFPETHMERLAGNTAMLHAVKDFIERDGPVYAECGGLMYLARSLSWRGKTCPMVGLLPGDVVMWDSPRGRGYVLLRETPKHPWPPVHQGVHQGASNDPLVVAHEFHYSSLENRDPGLTYAYQVLRGSGVDGVHDGIVYRRLLANYAHLRDARAVPWVSRFVQFVRLPHEPVKEV
ncbi:Cobyrinate a,c-diamide synthase [Gammaproteobacteria bacterium]